MKTIELQELKQLLDAFLIAQAGYYCAEPTMVREASAAYFEARHSYRVACTDYVTELITKTS